MATTRSTDLKQKRQLVRRLIIEGLEPDKIRRRIGMAGEEHDAEYDALIARFYDAEIQEVRSQSTERVYVDYVMSQIRNVNDLTGIIEELNGKATTASARVSAIRARSEIYDKIIARGQEFGLVDKKPEQKIVAGVLVGQLTNRQLRLAITEELSHLGRLMSKFGGEQSIVDVDPGPLHRDPPPTPKALPSGAGGKVKARARNKVHGGRRAVKKPAS